MPIARVQLADGRIARIEVPEGTTPEQAAAMAERVVPKQSQKPTSFWQGVAEGVAPAAVNAARLVERTNPFANIVRMATGRSVANAAHATGNTAAARSPYRGSTAGKITGEVIGTLPTAFLPGSGVVGAALQGAAGGAMLSPTDKPMDYLKSGAAGAAGGVVGQQVGKRLIAPVAERVGRTKVVRAAGQAVVNAANNAASRVTSRRVPMPPKAPRIAKPERVVSRAAPDLAEVRANIAQAADMNLPYSLADADPRLRALGGSVSRFSPDGRALAETNYGARAMGQADRAVQGIDQYLAPITDLEQQARVLRQQGSTASNPLYQRAYQAAAPDDAELQAMLQTPAGKAALGKAYEIAQNQGKNPAELGFLPGEGGVTLNQRVANESGRYAAERVGNPSAELTRQTVRGWNGAEVPKVGPVDLVGWLRMQGGLQDSGGELKAMGLNNAARKMDFAGQEQKFGPLVNPEGMNFDDAAQAAFDAGYFPGHAERPSINEFLYAMRGTQEGWKRSFLPDDQPELDRFYAAMDDANKVRQGRFEGAPVVRDQSAPAGMNDMPDVPLSAYDEQVVQTPTYETLDLVKRGFDAELKPHRNPVTNRLDLAGNPQAQAIEGLRQRYVGRLDELNPDYQAARGEFARYAQQAEGLDRGYKLASGKVPMRQVDSVLKNTPFPVIDQMERGYATAMADTVDRARLSSNPYNAIYGSPLQQSKVAAMFPQGAPKFNRQYGLENEMAMTRNEVLGGSQTQPRNIADQMFQGGVANDAVDMGIQAVTGGGVPGATRMLGALARYAKDRSQLGLAGAKSKADALAPQLFDTSNPRAAADYIDELLKKMAQERARKSAYQGAGGLLGVPIGAGVAAGFFGSP